jgi:methyl acetate hydrolase
MESEGVIAGSLKRAVEAGDVPGVVAAAATEDGVIFEGAAGALDIDSVIWIASMTKALTGAAAMQLVESGKLSLDAPAGDVVPELADKQVLEGFAGDGQPRLRPAKRPITLRHLLTHTSGLGYDTWNAEILRYRQATGIPAVGSCQNIALTTPLLAEPGERWEYSISIDWAGKMVEAASGQRLDRYMSEKLFQPLGMTIPASPSDRRSVCAKRACIPARPARASRSSTTRFPRRRSSTWVAAESILPPAII